MAKTAKKFSIGIYDRKHLKNLAKRLKTIEGILGASITEGCKIGMLSLFSDKEKEFYFEDYPEVEKKIDALMKKMHDSITSTIEEGDREAWMLSAQKNDALVDSLAEKTGITKEQIRKWKQPNMEALDAFQERKTEGMSLSDRVWNLTDQFKQELELAIELGLGTGKSAAELSRDVRQYLNEPNKLFRRVRDKHGVLRLSKAAKAYHPGRGVYRSSYKNALRLTATETNMAYRTADHERWQQLDFVTGIEIKLSNNHNCKGIPKGAFRDICDTLVGRYPKDFKFVGWHPFCRCQATPILVPWEQFLKSINEKTPGEPMATFKQETEYPQQFQEWVKDNKQKLQTARKLPYFVKDNPQAFMDAAGVKIKNKAQQAKPNNPPENDTQNVRKRTPRTIEEEKRIQNAWDKRRIEAMEAQWITAGMPAGGKLSLLLDKAKNEIISETYDHKSVKEMLDESQRRLKTLKLAAKRHGARTADEIRRIQDEADARKYGKEYVDAIHEMEKKLGMKRGKRMSVEEADKQNANPLWEPQFIRYRRPSGAIVKKVNPKYNEGYHINCQTCAPAYMLRLLGFDVKAGCNTPGSLLKDLSKGKSLFAWNDLHGKTVPYTDLYDWMSKKAYTKMNTNRYVEFWEENTKTPGVYIITINYDGGGGHTTILQRFKDGVLKYIEPQHDNLEKSKTKAKAKATLRDLASVAAEDPKGVRGIIRVDDKIFNLDLWAGIFVK